MAAIDPEQMADRAKAHLQLCDAVIRGMGATLWNSGAQEGQFAQRVVHLANQVYEQHLALMRQAGSTGDIIPLHCRVLQVESPYTRDGQTFSLGRVRIQPYVGRTKREQNMWIDLREPNAEQLVADAHSYVGQDCRLLQQVRMVLSPDGQPVLDDDDKPKQYHYVVAFEPAPNQPPRPAPAPAAPAPAAPAPAAPAPAPAAPAPAPAAPAAQQDDIPAGYTTVAEAQAARRQVLDKLAELRQVDEELYVRGKDSIRQQGLAWPQPPERIGLIIRMLDIMLQEHRQQNAPAQTPTGGATSVASVISQDFQGDYFDDQEASPSVAPPEDDHYEW
jgi:hypothetical protein